MKKIIALTLALLSLFLMTSCEKVEYVTDVTYRIYENGSGKTKSDVIGFYSTAASNKDGVWEYSFVDGKDIFEEFLSNSQSKESGMIDKLTIIYGTTVLKPKSEGKAKIAFDLKDESGNIKTTKYFEITSKKDKDGILRLSVEEIKE